MKLQSLMRFLVASHYTSHVDCPPALKSRGGIMLLAPPGQLKTAIIKSALDGVTGSVGLSDLNVQAMGRLRHSISTGKISTLCFYEYAKLYSRDAATSANLEGIISGLVDEGFHKLAFDVQEAHTLPCHALAIGAMVPEFYERRLREWIHSGFARRFVWILYRLENPKLVNDAIMEWREVSLADGIKFTIPSGVIPYTCKKTEAREIAEMLVATDAHGTETPAVLLQKIVCVLRWECVQLRRKDDAMQVLREVAEGMQKNGAKLSL